MNNEPIKYAYCRESTFEGKQCIDYQLNHFLEMGIKREHIYCEYASGMKEDRAELLKLLSIVKPHDSIYALEISRLSRSSKQLIEMIEFVRDNHLQLVIGTLDVDCREQDLDPLVKGMLQMMAVFAELERNMISFRCKEGVYNARKNGKRLGRPPFDSEMIPDKFYKYYNQYKNGELSTKKEICDLLHISRPTLDKWIKYVE